MAVLSTPAMAADGYTAGSGTERVLVSFETPQDEVQALDLGADTIDCGAGRDRVVTRDKVDRLKNCEAR